MSIKLFIHAGHGGSDRGAVGINGCQERNFNIKIRDMLIKRLSSYDVDIYTMQADIQDISHSAKDVTQFSNSIANLDLAIDIHCNAGGGQGFEVWVGKSRLCDAIGIEFCNQMKYINAVRGVKSKLNDNGLDTLYFIRELKACSLVLETAFVDNEHDYNILMYNLTKVIDAYMRTLVQYYDLKLKDVADTSTKLYCVQLGAFREKDNAEHLAKELKSKGYDVYIKEVN